MYIIYRYSKYQGFCELVLRFPLFFSLQPAGGDTGTGGQWHTAQVGWDPLIPLNRGPSLPHRFSPLLSVLPLCYSSAAAQQFLISTKVKYFWWVSLLSHVKSSIQNTLIFTTFNGCLITVLIMDIQLFNFYYPI